MKLVLDVFSGQMTVPVTEKLAENFIKYVKVPANMTSLFQPLDLTVNGSAKAFMKKKITEWYSLEVTKQLDNDKSTEEIEVKLLLSKLKPFHVSWLIDLYNHFTSQAGREVVANGWKAAGITDAIEKGSASLEPLTPFRKLIRYFNRTITKFSAATKHTRQSNLPLIQIVTIMTNGSTMAIPLTKIVIYLIY